LTHYAKISPRNGTDILKGSWDETLQEQVQCYN